MIVKVGPALYLVASGKGPPGGKEFGAAIGSLYGMAYTVKFHQKARGRDFKLSGLEGLWDSPPFSGTVRARDLVKLPWRLVLRVPEFVTRADLKSASRHLAHRGRDGGERVGLERLREGMCVQMLHVGPYSKEHRTVRAMDALARAKGYALEGPLHEIYLSNPGRVAPARLKTILRYHVKKARARS